MKNINKLLFSLSLLIVLQYAFCSYAIDQDSKKAIKEYNVSNETVINISAKDTEVYLLSHSGKNVTVIAEIIYKNNPNEKQKAFLDEFDQNVTKAIQQSSNELSISTDLNIANEKITKFKLFGTISYYNTNGFILKYTIKIPSYNTVKVNTSYKNLVVDGDLREAYININSGDLKANNIEKLQLQAKYGDVKVKNLINASMDLYEVDLEAEKIEKLKINSKYSDLMIDELKFSEIISYEDEFSITEARQMSGSAKYSKLSFKKQIKNLDLYMIYETTINAGFIEFIRLRESKYSKIIADEINKIILDDSYEDKLTLQELKNISIDGKYFKATIEMLTNSFKANLYEGDVKIFATNIATKHIEINGKYNVINLHLNELPFTLVADLKYGSVSLPSSLKIEKKLHIEENSDLKMEVNSFNYQKGLTLMFNGYETKVKLF